MIARLGLLLLLVLAGPATAAERSLEGQYRLVGEQDAASELSLGADGRFDYFLAAGALDERASGRWSSDGGVVTLTTEPRPVPPVFAPAPSGTGAPGPLRVTVSWPDGRGIAGIDLRIGFDRGEPLEAYTQEDGWELPADEPRKPLWIELGLPMHGLASPRFPIDPAAGSALAFTLVPNDLGAVDFEGVRIFADGRALIVERGGGRLRYERVGRR